jgi:pimeloyl-ACP methyl ester carboxylesterase
VAVIGLHGSGSNFYSSVTGFLSPALPSHGHTALSMNLRSHDRAYATSLFEDCEKDLRAGVRFMREQGFQKVVLFGHSMAVTQALYYVARSRESSVVGLVLSGGHDDLRGVNWQNWEAVARDSRAKYEEVVAECRRLVAQGDGNRLMIIPWWRPDPNLKLRQAYREVSAQTYLSYYAPESNCNASRWIPDVTAPMLFLTHSVVDTTARPEMSRRLQELAARAAFTDYVELEGSGHFYVGFEDQVIRIVVGWLDKLAGR